MPPPNQNKKTSPRRQLTSLHSNRRDPNDPVVASLEKNSVPYSSVALSWDRQYAITASNDTLQVIRIQPEGLTVVKTLAIAHHFNSSGNSGVSTSSNSSNTISVLHRDSFTSPFGRAKGQAAQSPAVSMFNVVITDLAWSHLPPDEQKAVATANEPPEIRPLELSHQIQNTFIAAAASNGVIVVWSADSLLLENGVPEKILSQHVRAVNSLEWHPRKPGMLLSASQDGKVLLWERRKEEQATATTTDQQQHKGVQKSSSTNKTSSASSSSASSRFNRFFGGGAGPSEDTPPRQSFSWHCRATFEPKEAVRDIQWSPFYEDGA
jgi:WD40 repeat protein